MAYTQSQQIRQTQKQQFSHAFEQYLSCLAKSKSEILAELRALLFEHPHVHTLDEAIMSVIGQTQSIKEQLYYQLYTSRVPCDQRLCAFIIESLDAHGFFYPEQARSYSYSDEDVQAALSLIQSFIPYGIATQGSIDFIRKQLYDQGETMALRILNEGSDALLRQDDAALCRQFSLSPTQLTLQMEIIRSCQLYPCQYDNTPTPYIAADIRVEIQEGALVLTPLGPTLKLPASLEGMSDQTRQYLEELHLAADMLDQRNFTLMLVFKALAQRQEDYLLKKRSTLAPCTLQDIADITGLHLSTISRACAHKYYERDGKIHAFHDLLCRSRHGKSHDEIRQALCEIIRQENSAYPYDDQQLSLRLQAMGIDLPRRRVSQYRKKWNIPNSYQRKKQNTDS